MYCSIHSHNTADNKFIYSPCRSLSLNETTQPAMVYVIAHAWESVFILIHVYINTVLVLLWEWNVDFESEVNTIHIFSSISTCTRFSIQMREGLLY